MVSVAAAHLCHCNAKAAKDDMETNECGFVSVRPC